MNVRVRAAVMAVGLGCASSAWGADEAPKTHRLYYVNILAARANPTGFKDSISLLYRLRLMDKPADNLLFGDTWLGIGPSLQITPAYARVGGEVRLVPIAVLRLIGRLETQNFFGSFNQVTSWSDTDVDWSDDAIDLRDDAQPMNGWLATLEGRVQVKVGGVAARNTFLAQHTSLPLPAGDVAYYDPSLDLLQPGEGWSFNNDADLLYVGTDTWVLGGRFSAAHAKHGDGSPADAWNLRAGPIIAKTLAEGTRGFHKPTAFLLTQWHLAHPYRTGQESSQAMPLIAGGIGWSGDLLP
jgi:hypothetical protein